MIKMFKSSSRKSRIGIALAGALMLSAGSTAAFAESVQSTPERQAWSFSGPFGQFDRAQLQRGFKVYREVCSACHSLNRVAFRSLSEPGGPEFSEGQVKELAASYTISDLNDKGEVVDRKGRPADNFPLVFPNDDAARVANNGAAPPDMSLLAKARGIKSGFPGFIINAFTMYQEQGPDYIHGLLANGYLDEAKGEKPPEGVNISDGLYYNRIFPGNAIAMANPLSDGQVEYTDGSPQTVDQYARDVSAFLAWAADPTLEKRKQTGFNVMIFLLVLTSLMYFTKKKVWSKIH